MDAIRRNTIVMVQEAFFDVCDILDDVEGDALEVLVDLKRKLAAIQLRLEGEV